MGWKAIATHYRERRQYARIIFRYSQSTVIDKKSKTKI
jgi:hypothetical protein